MGISSPLIGTSASPLLVSRCATPKVPLQKVDELSGDDFQDGCLSMLPAPCLNEHFTKSSVGPPSPLWPRTPPSLAQLEERNTFLCFNDYTKCSASPLVCSKPRSFSDCTCMLEKKPTECLDDFCLPDSKMFPSENIDDTTIYPEKAQSQEWYFLDNNVYLDSYGERYYAVCVPEHEKEQWYDRAWVQPSSFQNFPPPPPMPQGDHVYKPHWAYGSTWPFNCAPTTLVLEDLPGRLTQDDLVQILNDEGFNGLFDFLFLPVSLRSGRSSRYAVINFSRHSYGLLLAAHFHGRTNWSLCGDGSRCKVSWSLSHQGLPAILEHYRNDPNMHERVPVCMQPALFHNGTRAQMPAPTKLLREPRTVEQPWSRISEKEVQPCVDTCAIGPAFQLESTFEFPALD